jgi:hypothetical protein
MRGNQSVSSSLVQRNIEILTSSTDRLITSKDHASVQINIVDVDSNGRALNTSTTLALCGQVRSQGESDDAINRLATKAGCALQSCSFLECYVLTRLVFSAEECVVVPEVKLTGYFTTFYTHTTPL